MRGDYVELDVRRETVSDGCGCELEGIAVRVWGEADSFAEDRDVLLLAELTIPSHDPLPEFPPLGDLIDHVLSTMEVVCR